MPEYRLLVTEGSGVDRKWFRDSFYRELGESGVPFKVPDQEDEGCQYDLVLHLNSGEKEHAASALDRANSHAGVCAKLEPL